MMSLYVLLLLSVAFYFVVKHALTPWAKRRGGESPLAKRVGRPALLAGLKFAGTLFFLTALTYAAMASYVLVAGWAGGATSADFGRAVESVQAGRGWLKSLRFYWTAWLFVFIGFGLAVFAYRRERRRLAEEVERAKGELRRDEGGWDKLEPTPEMERLLAEIAAAQRAFDELDPSRVHPTSHTQDARRFLSQEIRRLRALWREADVERRAHLRLDAEEEGASRGRKKATDFVMSKGFLGSLQSGSRLLTNVGLILLLLSVVGVNTPVLDGALASRAVSLSELQVKASETEARESYEKLLDENADGGQTQLEAADEEAADGLAREFERAFADSTEWNDPERKEEEEDDYENTFVRLRVPLVRDQIIAESRRNPPGGGGAGPKGPPPTNPNGGPKTDPSGPRETAPGPVRPNGPSSEPPHAPPPPGPADRPGGGPPEPPAVGGDEIRQRIADERGPRGGLGDYVARDLRATVATKSKSVWTRLKGGWAEYKAKFGEPFAPFELRRFAVAETTGVVLDATWPLPSGPANDISKTGSKAVFKEVAKNIYDAVGGSPPKVAFEDSVKRVYEVKWKRFVADIADGATVEEALGKVRRGGGRAAASLAEVERLRAVTRQLPARPEPFALLKASFEEFPPSVQESATDLARARAAAAEVKRGGGGERLTATQLKALDAADIYEDHYPSQRGAQTRTPRALALKELGRPSPGEAIARTLYAQSRDLAKLRAAPDVGGVLLGRDPAGGTADFRGLAWEADGDKVTLLLTRADGAVIRLGPFEQDLVNRALLYVADDRKTAVTIIYGEGGTAGRKVLLHPAIVDTRVGNDIIRLDKFVFDFLPDEEPLSVAARRRIESQRVLYGIAAQYRLLGATRHLLERRTEVLNDGQRYTEESLAKYRKQLADLRALIAGDEARLARLIINPEVRKSAEYPLQHPAELSDPSRSLLQRQAFYDSQLVADMRACAGEGGGTLKEFGSCIAEAADRGVQSLNNDALNAQFKQWATYTPPKLSPRSIAEETPFAVDPELRFLSAGQGTEPAARLWPLEFRYEIALPLEARFAVAEDAAEGARAPVEYEELRPEIARRVSEGVGSHEAAGRAFRRVRDFTVIQRLVRVALSGDLGRRFPVERFVALTRDTAQARIGEATPRTDVSR